jgi:hypothetical protein
VLVEALFYSRLPRAEVDAVCRIAAGRVCGVLKIVYDLSLLFSFRHIKPPEES